MVFQHPLLRTIALVNTIQSLGASVAEAVILIFAYRLLHLSPGLVGIAIAVGSMGDLLGTVVVSRATRKLGVGPTLGLSSLLGACSYLLIPFGLFGFPAAAIAVWRLLYGLHISTYNSNQDSLRQTITPDRFQGHMNATIRTTSHGVLGIGPLIGGLLGTSVGLVPTILLGECIYVAATALLLTRSMRTLKAFPPPVRL